MSLVSIPWLDSLPGKRVLVVGDVMLDEYVWGEAKRISPEAPVPVLEVRSRSHVPGGAGNVAANLAGLRGQPVVCGVVGDDGAGRILTAELERRGVDDAGMLIDASRPTTTKTRLVAHNQQIARMDTEARLALSPQLEARLLGRFERLLAEADVCVLSDYGKGVVSTQLASRIITLCARRGCPVVVDPKGSHYAKYRGASVVKPNVHELALALKEDIEHEDDLRQAGRRLQALLEGSAVLVTRGAQGMMLFERGRDPLAVSALARKVYDVTGAGDTVTSVLALALAAGAALDDAVHLANFAASIVVGAFGTMALTFADLVHHLTTAEHDLSSANDYVPERPSFAAALP